MTTQPRHPCPAATLRGFAISPTASAGLLLALLLIASGCAAFPAKRIPAVGTVRAAQLPSGPPTAYIGLRWIIDLQGGDEPGIESSAQLPKLRKVVEDTISQSRVFSAYTFEAFQAKDMDYALQVELKNYGSRGLSAMAGFITGLTLFVIPSAATDNYRLTAKLFDKQGQLIQQYTYEDAVTTWIGIWLLPLAGNTPESVAMATIENMVKALLRDVSSVIETTSRSTPTRVEDKVSDSNQKQLELAVW